MKVTKCYYCGGENESLPAQKEKIQCQYCRRWIAIPNSLDQEKQALYDLGKQQMSLLRFQEAEEVFASLISKEPENGDIYWQALLCHFGIEYCLDESSGLHVPTVTLLSREPILENEYYRKALQYADSDLRATYQAEANHINSIMLAYEQVAASVKPYDVFISVKQGTSQGTPTSDSFEAAKLMKFLEDKGLRVFNSRFSLKDTVGREYEPYIIAALMSSRAMVVVSSCREYIESGWVRNEWRRYRWLMDHGTEKRVLIPYLLGMNPGDVPSEIGAIQCVFNTSSSPYADILRAIRKTVPLAVPKMKRPTVIPDQIEPEEKEKWLETVRSDLAGFEELRDSVMPDLATARNADLYLGIILNNLKKLEGYGESYRLTQDAANLQKHFRQESARFRLNELNASVELISERMNKRISDYGEACSILDELSQIHNELAQYKGWAGAEAPLQKTKDLLNEIRRIVVRLNPNNIVSDPLRRSLAVGNGFIAGLRRDGTVLLEGKNKEVVAEAVAWADIVSIVAGDNHLVGLKRDGSVVAAGKNKRGQCNVSSWKNVICVTACADHTVCLDEDGNCFGTGNNSAKQLNVESWREIVSIATSGRFTIACNRKGQVFSTGDDTLKATHISGWSEIDRVFALRNKAVGIRTNGEVLMIGNSPKEEIKQVRKLNKDKQLYRSIIPGMGQSVAALTGTGSVHLVPGKILKLPLILSCFLFGIFLFILGGSIFGNRYPEGPDAVILKLLSMFFIFLAPILIIASSAKFLTETFAASKWSGIVEIAADDKKNTLIALRKEGTLVARKQAELPQWYGLGLPDLNE